MMRYLLRYRILCRFFLVIILMYFIVIAMYIPEEMKEMKEMKEKESQYVIHKSDAYDVTESQSKLEKHFEIAKNDTNKEETVQLQKEEEKIDTIHKAHILPAVDPNAPGEMGKGIEIDIEKLSIFEKKKYDDGWKNNAFNEYISDMISLHRTLPETRDEECKNIEYTHLTDVSVIICFTDESWSALLRSVHSVIDHSPPHLLREIILVDDFSLMDNLKRPLDDYMATLPKVKVIHAPERMGLIRARMLGTDAATGTVLFFLDSHIECTEGWLEPVVDLIEKNETTAVTPIIDVIDASTFKFVYAASKDIQVGGFTMSLGFNWHLIPERDNARRDHKTYLPARSPTMAGGLFAISKKYFDYLGRYDEGFDIWGAENLELSFKIWMCGGTLVTAPCSHVGHIFRKRAPYKSKPGQWFKRNNVRLAEVWLDEYKNYFYEKIGYDLGDFGDVSSRKELRERLNCKSFEWFIDNIYPEMFLPHKNAIAFGEIRNRKVNVVCLEGNNPGQGGTPITTYSCHGKGGNQYWLISDNNEIRRDDTCVDYNSVDGSIATYDCHGHRGNQQWQYTENDQLRHPGTNTCLELMEDYKKLQMKPCAVVASQQWDITRGVPPFPSKPN